MTLGLLVAIVRAQGWVLAAGLAIAIGLGLGLLVGTPRQYEARAIVVVSAPGLLPADPERPYEGDQITNPLVRSDGSLSDVARLLVADASLDRAPADPTLTVSGGTEPTFLPVASPFITVSATGADPTTPIRSVTREVALLGDQLDLLQQQVDVRSGTSMTLQTVAAPAAARVGLVTASRTLLVAPIGILALAVLVAFARVDGARLRDAAGEVR